jgi:hypothetical protein
VPEGPDWLHDKYADPIDVVDLTLRRERIQEAESFYDRRK